MAKRTDVAADMTPADVTPGADAVLAVAVTAPSAMTCAACGDAIGDAAKVSPVFVGARGPHCPPCFVGKIAAHDPGRWGTSRTAARCIFCGFVTLVVAGANGQPDTSLTCGRCGGRAARPVAAKE